ncbi:hypothetical protein BJ138DRAFT_1018973, partial [Hygrophoropsis aurantiaca]
DAKNLFDDALAPEEMDFVVGTYYVDTAQDNQSLQLSWWPKHHIWVKCGLYVGTWSSRCEEWFQTRLQHIRNGTTTLKTQAEWKKSLKFNKSTNAVVDANTVTSHDFILHNCRRPNHCKISNDR